MDFFKTVNDVYGHARGDLVLRQVAERVAGLSRRGDTLFRYGGDEFVLLLPGTGRDEAVRLALRITDGVRAAGFPGEPPLFLTISLGVAAAPGDGDTPAALLAAADRRNYLAKRRGRDGAVADDAEDAATGDARVADTGGRLWERDAALATTHDYLTRLAAADAGVLRVTGQPGAGHTRFLAEVARLAAMRGFTVVPIPAAPAPPPVPSVVDGPVLLLADVDAADRVAAARAAYGDAPVLGVVVAQTTAPPDEPGTTVVELTPWSPAALRIWLRAALRGEPSRTLVGWLARQSGGLPAAAGRELERLRARGGLEPAPDGGWTISPALLGRPRRRVRVPAPITSLVGREEDTRRVAALLATGRLVTLAGPGGVGKTRLSMSVAGAAADEFDDGVTFVALSQATDAGQVVAAIAAALGVEEAPGQEPAEALAEHLADARILLVLDNFEQAIDAGPAIGELLAAAPGVAALVTSREPLGIYGEQVYRVLPLPLPDLAAVPLNADPVAYVLRQSPAVALFAQRAPGFALTAADLPTVVQLCRLLDGLPLAIELVAARADAFGPAALLADLDRHFGGTGPRDRPPRQQTLRGAVDWSYALLDEAERELFRSLAVLVGGATVDSARAVTGVAAGDRLPGLLDGLVAKSLLTAEPEPGGGTRYGMLYVIRAHARLRLAEAGGDAVRRRHLDHEVGVAERAAAGMTGPEQAEWADRLHREYPNLRAAMAWAMDAGRVAEAGRICAGLWRYWRNGEHLAQGREWLDRVLAYRADLPGPLAATLLYAAGVLAITQGDADAAAVHGTEALRLAESNGDRPAAAQARNTLGIAALIVGDDAAAAEHFRYGLAVWRELGQPEGTAIALGNLAKAALRRGAVAEAAGHVDECLALERAAGNRRGVLLGLECLAEIRLAQHDPRAARQTAAEALDLARALGDVFGEAMALHQLGLAARAGGDRAGALPLFLAALERRHDLGDAEDLAVSLGCVADALIERDPRLAARLLGAVDTLRRRHRIAAQRDAEERDGATWEAARAVLSAPVANAARREGRTCPLDLIVDQCLDVTRQGAGLLSVG